MLNRAVTPEILAMICDSVSCGDSIRVACSDAGVPPKTFYRLLARSDDAGETARRAYASAINCRADARFEAIDEIVQQMLDEVIDPKQARVAIDAMKWQCGKERPTRYGDSQRLIEAEVTRDSESPIGITVRIIDGTKAPGDESDDDD